MDTDLIKLLIETGYTWHLRYYQTLCTEDEFDFTPKQHWGVDIIVSYEESALGWGDTPDAAARDALANLETEYPETEPPGAAVPEQSASVN